MKDVLNTALERLVSNGTSVGHFKPLTAEQRRENNKAARLAGNDVQASYEGENHNRTLDALLCVLTKVAKCLGVKFGFHSSKFIFTAQQGGLTADSSFHKFQTAETLWKGGCSIIGGPSPFDSSCQGSRTAACCHPSVPF